MSAGDFFSWIGENVAVLYIPFLVWQTKMLLKMNQTVYGENGNGGLTKAVETLTQIAADHATVDIRLLAAQKRADEAHVAVEALTDRIVSALDDLRRRTSVLESKRR